MSFLIVVVVLLRSLFLLDNLVLVVRQVELSPLAELVTNLVVPVEANLVTP